MAAPSSTRTTTSTRMLDPNDNSAGTSDQPSVGTPGSSQMDTFDFTIDPSDPLAFLMNASGSDHSGDSSTEDSYRGTSTPPSSHGSPSSSAALPQTKPVDTSAFSFLTQQAFDDGLEFPMDLQNDLSGMDYSIFGSSMFSNGFIGSNAMQNSQAPTQYIAGPTTYNKPAYPFNFSQASAFPQADQMQSQQRNEVLLQPPEQRVGDISSASSSTSSTSSPLLNPSQFAPTTPQLPLSNAPSSGNEPQMSGNQTINDLAQRVRELVGVNMALPSANAGQEQPKVPIPRLQRPAQAAPAPKRKQSMPPSTTPSPLSAPAFSATPTVSAPAPIRTKTAHTTIERRYRTNINARIQSLRAAVPALRVLEERAGNRIGNLNIKGDAVDVIDERGYVDGVKVARKGSKANVLGKAVEYINVLKRRELRLTREKEGLRSLICSLVGGPALLKEWETMWVEQFGGPEMDEAQNAEQAEADDENDDEDDDGEDGEDDDGIATKKRKRSAADNSGVKVKKDSKGSSSSTLPSTAASNPAFSVIAPGQPEKRKRGRPRKLPLPASTPNTAVPVPMDVNMSLDALYGTSSMVGMPTPEQFLDQQRRNQLVQYQQHVQPGQYLLAAFAFFSFFNSPVSYYATSSARSHDSSRHTHSGVVLDATHGRPYGGDNWSVARVAGGLGWRDVVQVVHVAVSLLLLLSIVGPWLPNAFRRRYSRAMPRVLRPFLGLPFTPRPHSDSSKRSRSRDSQRSGSDSSGDEREDASARDALSSALLWTGVDVQHTTRALLNALGLRPGVFGMLSSCLQVVFTRGPGAHRLERRVLEQRVFTRLAELVALDVTASSTTRIQTYVFASKFISTSSASASDLATLALVIQPLWASKATALWDMALAKIHRKSGNNLRASKPYETLVLEDMSVDDAMERIRRLDAGMVERGTRDTSSDSDEDSLHDFEDSVTGPLAVLSRQLVFEYIRDRAEAEFVQLVFDVDSDKGEVATEDSTAKQTVGIEERSHCIVTAGKSLDRTTRELVVMYSKTCDSLSTPTSSVFDEDDMTDDEEAEDDSYDADEREIMSLLRSVELYRKFFPTLLLRSQVAGAFESDLATSQPPRAQPPVTISLDPMPSPPPSPSKHDVESMSPTSRSYLSLRRRLASPAFDRSDILEDARDHVVEALEYGLIKSSRGC
ncbi:hypothetical protein SCHPADRAFT_925688 [Schizopora paradoxa]|uniref:BHLH domain-containing protein n=1 Tax=Schizopora paradoxa TaxID=27342 RepID=A0A0H2RZY6_9AGAM|nr:hypothetical protein SCHPADRAFT_925688 [Schizopora paradoxa]